MELIVCKFGGSSVATVENLKQILSVIKANKSRRCVVLSAPGKAQGIEQKVTDQLIAVVEKSLAGNPVAEEIDNVKKRYLALYGGLGLAGNDISEVIDDLDTRIAADKSNPLKYRDLVVASGEDYNAQLYAKYLAREGLPAAYFSPAEIGLIVTAQFGDAQPETASLLEIAKLKETCEETIAIIPGFFGATAKGDIATFSRGGSDLTGALMAEALDAVEYENFTDVDGIFSSNPKLVDNPMQIPALTYKEMRELSYIGFNVFHEEAVWPAMRKKIPIRLRNTNNLDNPGTLIVAQRLPSENDVVGVTCDGGYCSFNLEKFLMNREKGFGRKLLSIFEELDISYEHCPSSVDSISVILDQEQLTSEMVNEIIRTIEDQLQPDEVRSEYGIALLAVVGEGLAHKIGVLGQAANALAHAGVNIKMVNQGSSEISIIFGIDASDEKKAINALYGEFFT
ncbi:MAG: aspartate kinase [Chitinivibrionales bacterium]|nr:aspartate kinase [Chitinivibrionales bacterium]